MCPVLYGVSGIFPLGGSAAALTRCGAPTRPAPARPVPPTVTPSAPRNFRRSTVLGLSMDFSPLGPFCGPHWRSDVAPDTLYTQCYHAFVSGATCSKVDEIGLGPRPISPAAREFRRGAAG